MAIQPGVWGIDLGQCALKAIRLQESEGELVATAFDYVEHPKILSQPDADPDQLIREALEKFLSRNSLRGDVVAISVPGQSGLARFVKLPPVEEKKISDIVRFEARQQIPFNLDEVVWDYQKIGSGVVTDGFAMETEIGLFAMKRDMIQRYLQHFQEVNVEVNIVQMAPLALCNYVAFDLLGKGLGSDGAEGAEQSGCVVALDIGADSSNLVVTDGGRVIWQRPIPIGGNHFTRALTKDLKLTFAKAEHLKRNAAKNSRNSEELKKILAALKPVLNDFVGEVQRSLGYFANTHRDAQLEYMVGLGNAFRLPGLQRFLAEKLQMDVRKLQKLERAGGDAVVTAPVFSENILTFGVAYGLALQAGRRARLITNLLPEEIRFERLVRAKKPWAAAAAAVLFLGLAGMGLSYALEQRTYGTKGVEAAIGQSSSVAQRATTAQKAYDDAVAKAKQEEEAVKSLLAGQAERTNWLKLLKFVGECLPQPNGDAELPPYLVPPADKAKKYTKVLPQSVYRTYWLTRPGKEAHAKGSDPLTGQEAYKEFLKRLKGGQGDDTSSHDSLGTGIDDLVQINLEAVEARYCDDLGTFWKAVTAQVRDKGAVRPMTDWAKAPEGKGWVVELRGSTYHHKKSVFVLDTLVENIARLGIHNPSAPADANPAGGGATPSATPPADPMGQTPSKAEVKEPIIDHISHVVLFNALPKPVTSSSTPLEIAQTSALSTLLKASAGGVAGPPGSSSMAPPGMMPMGGGATDPSGGAAAAPTRDSWVPIGSAAGAAGQQGFPPGMAGPPGGRPPFMPMGPGGLPGAAQPGQPAATGGHTRTEFVILFVWKEPTPSDDLRGTTDGGGDSASPSPAPPSGMAPMPPGMPS